MNYYQQGDVLLFESDKPKGLKKLKTDLLHKGQQNHHRMRGKFSIGKVGDTVYLESTKSELFHEEHETIKIGKGFYRLGIALEYDHQLQESRRVID